MNAPLARRFLLLLAAALLLEPRDAPAAEACCLPDGLCLDMETAECAALSGTAGGSTCDVTACEARSGACCVQTPFGTTCGEESEAACRDGGGGFLGFGTTCATAECLRERGCCAADGTCADRLPGACGRDGGTPADVPCASATCVAVEACCLPGATACYDVAPADCLAAGGAPAGPGSRCAADPCALELVACCFGDGSCNDLSRQACLRALGRPLRSGTACAATPCLPEEGACCTVTPFGVSCFDASDPECADAGGTYLGIGTRCATAGCGTPRACCHADGSCTDAAPPQCLAAGGALQGEGSACATTSCPQPPRPCCLLDGTCDERTPASCAAVGGTSHAGRCGDVACDAPRPGWVPNGADRPGEPLRVRRGAATNALDLAWGASCSRSVADYAVYEGALGAFAAPEATACSTGGLTSLLLAAAPGNRFILVTPTIATQEGSLGHDSFGRERAAAALPCRSAQDIGCP